MVITYSELQVSISTLYEALTGTVDYCGEVEVSVSLNEGRELPYFIVFDDYLNTIEIAPTRYDEIGSYQVVLSYVLVDY